jgi:hypothetical protein
MPLLSSHNRYACLVVDRCEDATSVFKCAKVVPQPSPPPQKVARICLANWECRLPKKFVIATTPSKNSLNIDIEIETTDTVMERNTNVLVDCSATGLFVNAEYVRSNNISTHHLTTPSLSTMLMELRTKQVLSPRSQMSYCATKGMQSEPSLQSPHWASIT